MSQKSSVDLGLFCPRKNCPYHNDSHNKIIKDGFLHSNSHYEKPLMLYKGKPSRKNEDKSDGITIRHLS